MIQPIQGNILIEPIVEESAWATSQTQYEERGKVISLGAEVPMTILVDDIIYFDSWQAARFKDGNGKDVWLVHMDAVRAVEKENG